ncbi:MAG: DMT family transporter [Clostridia bacterium]|nr:DMT family transporter [Clostridia bacterium]
MNRVPSRTIRANALLVLTALIWGVAFVAQKSGGVGLGVMTINGLRSLLGSLGLLAAVPLLDKLGLSHRCESKEQRRTLWRGGILCGLAMFAATNLQQFGINDVSEGKAAFTTALYIVLVPILGLLLHRRTTLLNWVGVVLAAVGLYFLCAMGETGFGLSDILLLLCALMFSVQIMLVDHFSPKVDGVRLSCIQFLVVGVLNLPLMFIFESPTFAGVYDNLGELLYLGLLSCGVAYTLQIVAQKDTAPATASLIMSLESVFGALAGWLIAGHAMGGYEILGGVLMFAAVVLAQLPPPKRRTPDGAI